SPNKFNIQVESDDPGMLVVSQSWHPDWRATVNGRTAVVQRVNHALVGVPVPSGASYLEFSYFPWDFYLGAAVSLATIVGMACVAAVRFFRNRRRGSMEACPI